MGYNYQENGNSYYVDDNNDKYLVRAGGTPVKVGHIDSATSTSGGTVKNLTIDDIDKAYHAKYGTGMPGSTFDQLKNGKINSQDFYNTLTKSQDTLMSEAASDSAIANKYTQWGLITSGDLGEYKTKAETEKLKAESEAKAAKNKADAQILPSELTTIEDWANQQMKLSAPEFDSNLVAEWKNTLQPVTDIKKSTMNENASNAFSALFPQGGGSTYEANKLAKALQGIDAETLATATAYAQADQNQKYATWAANQDTAKSSLGSIANYKKAAENFSTTQDANNYWNTIANNLNNTQYWNTQNYNNDMWNKNAALSTQLANSYSSAKANPWESLLPNIISSGVGALTSWALPTKKV